MLQFFSCLLVCCSIFSSSLMERFEKEIFLWPKHAPSNDPLYQNVKQLKNFSVKPKIPKIIHQIWLGGPVPEKFNEAMQSWKLHHPEWTYMLWTDKDVELFKMQNKNLFKKSSNYGMKSDLLRMEILDRYGGLYVDVDQYCIKPHDIFHHVCSFYVAEVNLNNNPLNYVNNNLIGASKGNLIVKKWLKKVRLNFKDKDLVWKGNIRGGLEATFTLTGPWFLTSLIKMHKYKDCLVLENNFFNSLDSKYRRYIDISLIEKEFKPYSYSVHFHTCSWFKPI